MVEFNGLSGMSRTQIRIASDNDKIMYDGQTLGGAAKNFDMQEALKKQFGKLEGKTSTDKTSGSKDAKKTEKSGKTDKNSKADTDSSKSKFPTDKEINAFLDKLKNSKSAKKLAQDFEKKLNASKEAEQKKFAEVDKKRSTVKASNGMTYNQIQAKLNQIAHGNWGVVPDPKTGKLRFPNISEIHESLKSLAQKDPATYGPKLKELESLLAAKHELEEKNPEFKDTKFMKWHKDDGSVEYLPGSIDVAGISKA